MLTLTDDAANAIKDLATRAGLPGEAGVRIATRSAQDMRLTIALADGPGTGDQVLEDNGARVFLDPMAARVLDDRALDVDQSKDGEVAFRIAPQESGA